MDQIDQIITHLTTLSDEERIEIYKQVKEKISGVMLPLTYSEILALDRILLLVSDAKKNKQRSVRIPLTNEYFVEKLMAIKEKKFIQFCDKERAKHAKEEKNECTT